MNEAAVKVPTQADDAAWRQTRGGRFTASVIGKLFTEPRTLTAQHVREYCYLLPDTPVTARTFKAELKVKIEEAGIVLFGDTALACIASKAAERLSCRTDNSATTRSMERGTLLEYGARILLSKYWKEIDGISWQGYGENSGATPDGLVEKGTETLDIKCPESFGDLVLFEDAVPDGDFEALESWNKGYAWQIMMQAKASGTKHAWLVYFTDRWPRIVITEEERRIVQQDIDEAADILGNLRGYPMFYRFDVDPDTNVAGFAYVAKRFELTEERSNRIDRVLKAAEDECQRFMALMS